MGMGMDMGTRGGGAVRGCAIAAAMVLAAPGPARADSPAQTQPTRDVDITYRADVADAPGTALLQRLRFSAALRRERLDMPTSGHWMLLDLGRNTLTLVRESEHSAMTGPAGSAAAGPAPQQGQHWQRGADIIIAGAACTLWAIADDAPGRIGTEFCLTADGAMLRVREGERVVSEAISVSYAPQDAAIFAIPQGYRSPQDTP